MNCDDFLTAQETGGYLARPAPAAMLLDARACAALRAKFAGVKLELASPEPLSARARRLWKDAASETARQAPPRRNWIFIAGGLAAAACVVLLVVKLAGHKPGDLTPSPPRDFVIQTPQVTESTITVVAPADELAELSEAANQLDVQLKQLRLEAQRMDARRQVAMTLERFEKW